MAPRKTSAASKKAAAAVTEKTKTTTTSTSNKRTSSSGGPAANAKRSRTSAEKPAKATKPAAAPAPAKPAPAKRAHRVPARSRTLAQKKVQPTTPAAPPSPPAVINKAPTERFELWSFGSGSTGELGKGPKRNVLLSPRPVDSLADAGHVVQVAPGGMHVAALTSNGRVFTWGQNDTKNLGRDTTWDPEFKDQDDADAESLNPLESTPAPIPEDFFPKGTKITQLAASDSATFALTETGQVYGWGVFRNENGVWGFYREANGRPVSECLHIAELKNIVSIHCAPDTAYALDKDGVVFSWGKPDHQLGRHLPHSSRQKENSPSLDHLCLVPAPLYFANRKIASIHVGGTHTFAIDRVGDVWAWGYNNYAQTGITTNAGSQGNSVPLPRRVGNLHNRRIRHLSGGVNHTLALTADGDCLAWGRLDFGTIGIEISSLPVDDPKSVVKNDGVPRILLTPTKVALEKVSHICAGPTHNLVVSDNKAYSWGYNHDSKCGCPDRVDEDIVVPHRVQNKWMVDRTVVWSGSSGNYSLIGLVPEEPQDEKPEKSDNAAKANETKTT